MGEKLYNFKQTDINMKKIFILSVVTVAWIAIVLFIFERNNNHPVKTDWIKTKYLDISYADESPREKLDIYLPNDGKGPFPVIIAIHGGAFKFGDKTDSQLTPMLEGLKRGYAVVSINYRLSWEAKWPAQINDVKAAIKFIRVNAKKLNLNPDKIAVWGGSGGGILAALAGTSGDVKSLEDENLGYPNVSSKVQAVVDWFGPINFIPQDEQRKVLGLNARKHVKEDSFDHAVEGLNITDIPRVIESANPSEYITSDDPSFYIESVIADPSVPYFLGKEFADKLKTKVKNEVVFETINGSKHDDPAFADKENLDKIYAFLDRHLK